MDKIIAVCKRHRIAMIADFAVPNERDSKLKCTTVLLDDAYEPGDEMISAAKLLFPLRPRALALTITKEPINE